MRIALKVGGGILAALLLLVASGYLWASNAANRSLSRTIEAHTIDFPIPYPAQPDELGERSAEEAEQLATARAIERGKHLVESRYACMDCHGEDFSGGVMVDAFPIGRLHGPNLTGGVGSRVASFTTADWDRVVRHGIMPGNTPSAMPSQDFRNMSDQELADIITYIRSLPAVDNEVAPIKLGPLGKVLIATGQIPLSADLIQVHDSPHRELPPQAEVSIEFGGHLAATCTGCHGIDFSGGPIPGGDPSWPAAANLTPLPDGLGSWSYADFRRVMLEGTRPDGSSLQPPMSAVVGFAQQMTPVELEALWVYLQSLPLASSEG